MLALYSQPSFSEQQLQSVLPHLNVGSLTLNGERTRYLNAVLVVEEGEPLPVNVQQLYVLGFNNGHYQYQPAYTGALSRQQWDDLALPIPTQAAEQQRWQQGFRQLLSRATNKLVFLRALADAEGKRLDPQRYPHRYGPLCYCPADKLAPESLEQPLANRADIWADIKPTRSATPQLEQHARTRPAVIGPIQNPWRQRAARITQQPGKNDAVTVGLAAQPPAD